MKFLLTKETLSEGSTHGNLSINISSFGSRKRSSSQEKNKLIKLLDDSDKAMSETDFNFDILDGDSFFMTKATSNSDSEQAKIPSVSLKSKSKKIMKRDKTTPYVREHGTSRLSDPQREMLKAVFTIFPFGKVQELRELIGNSDVHKICQYSSID